MASMGQDFTGKVAIVTGGASGIGEAVAQAIAARGGQVVIADIDQNDAERVVTAISETGGPRKQLKPMSPMQRPMRRWFSSQWNPMAAWISQSTMLASVVR